MVKGAVAFVASTLPFQQIARYHRELGVTEVVCAGPSLANSYRKGFEHLGLSLAVSGLAGRTRSTSVQLLWRLLRAPEIVIFHECCWFQIDFLILLSRRKVRYFPTVTLSGRKKVTVRDLPLNGRLRGYLVSRWFDIYETPLDGVDGVYHAFAVKERFRKVDANTEFSGLVPPKPRDPSAAATPAVLLLSSTDYVPDQVLRDLYVEIIQRLMSIGVVVHIKDHPRPDARLRVSHPASRELDADLPLECLDLTDYCAFLSLASTSIAAGRGYGEIISVARLLPSEYWEKLRERLRFLDDLHIKPHTPRTVDELVEIVKRKKEAQWY